MSSSLTEKSHVRLKWKMRRLASSLEILDFEKLTTRSSKLSIHTIYESIAQRDQLLQLPFAQGINMAHNRLQKIVSKLK